MISRGSICWVDLGPERGSRPATSRPVLVLQGDQLNASRIATTVVAVLTSNTAWAEAPGNAFLPKHTTGLAKDSVANLTALVTIDKKKLDPPVGHLPEHLMASIDQAVRTVLGL